MASTSTSTTTTTTPTSSTLFSSASADQAATFRSFYRTYNSLSEECFHFCVWDMGVAKMRAKEARCVDACAANHLAVTKEIGERFADAKEKEILHLSRASQ